jgi:putative membrane protein
MEYKENNELRKKLDIAAYILSAIVIGLVIAMRPAERFEVGFDTMWMPGFNAAINTLAAICLIFAFYFIKQKNIGMHRNMIMVAMVLSVIFLLVYVLYHFTTPETSYCKEGTIKFIYYFLLISHITLAGISLPFILLTFNRGFTFSIVKHKKLARWVFPLWLYVVFTGPVVYLMLKPCYGV